jgi:hypothetical protein
MYTATIQVSIAQNGFQPIATGNTTAILTGPTDTSPGAPTGVFKGTAQDLIVATPSGYTGVVQVTYQMPGTDYTLLGIAVKPASPGASLGRQEFRMIAVNRDSNGSQMVVTDSCLSQFYGVNFEYLILVQRASDGAIGQIDPDDENEPQ